MQYTEKVSGGKKAIKNRHTHTELYVIGYTVLRQQLLPAQL